MLSIAHELPSWLVLLLAFALFVIYQRYHNKCQPEIPIVGVPPVPLGSWIAAFKFIGNSTTVLGEGFSKYGPDGKSFKISTPARWVIVVTDDAVLKELSKVDENILSMQAAANERNSISYILSDCIHERPVHVGIILKYLTRRLLEVLPETIEHLDGIFSDIPTTWSSWTKVDLQALTTKSISFFTNRVLVGRKLANDQEFLESVLELSTVVSDAGLLIDLSPRFLKSILARYLVPKRGAFHVYLSKLSAVFEERRKVMQEHGGSVDRQDDAIQWILEATPTETPVYDLCVYILYIQFSAIHTSSVSLVNALYDLAIHTEFRDPIKNEIEQVLQEHGGWTKQALRKMKMLDSSLRESQRLYPATTATMMRKAMRPCTLSDGTRLSKGQWVVVPAWAINRSNTIYPNPNEFDAFRFSKMSQLTGEETKYQMSNSGEGYVSFGLNRHACPGRFFTAMELKVVSAYIIRRYDFKLDIEKGGTRPQNNSFCFSYSPDSNLDFMLKPKDLTCGSGGS